MKAKENMNNILDYSKKENQIGCGYCSKEQVCKIRTRHINKAKDNCKDYEHFKSK